MLLVRTVLWINARIKTQNQVKLRVAGMTVTRDPTQSDPVKIVESVASDPEIGSGFQLCLADHILMSIHNTKQGTQKRNAKRGQGSTGLSVINSCLL